MPLVISLLFTIAMGQWYPPEALGLNRWVWVGLVFVLANILLYILVRLARLLTPLAGLMTLSLVFPDQAPSRSKAALRKSNSTKMLREIQAAQLLNDGSAGAMHADYLVQLLKDINDHDRLTRGHSERVRAYSELLGEELGLKGDDLDKLRWAALLHDVGKLSVPAEILSKNGRPTDEEWEILKTHPAESNTYLEPLLPWLGEWALAAEEHHSRFDGTGYPKDLDGRDISLAGRIVAVADAYDVMTSARSYKKALAPELARQELTACAGTQFDPRIVSAFLRIGLGDLRAVAGPWAWLANLTGSMQLPVPVATGAATSAWTAVAATASLVVASPPAEDPGPFAFVPDPVVEEIESATIAPELPSLILRDDIIPVDEDSSVLIAVLANDEAPEGAALQIVDVAQPGYGTVSIEGPNVRYTPAPNFSGVDSFSYTVTDGISEPTEATVNVTVNAVNDPPSLEVLSALLGEDAEPGEPIFVINPEDPDGDEVTITLTNGDPAGIFALNDNVLELVGELDYETQTRFDIEITADDGIEQRSVLMSIDIADVDEPPTTGSETVETAEEATANIAIGANDSDVEGALLTWSVPERSAAGGLLTASGGSVTYTPPTNFFGQDSFSYTVSDGTHDVVEQARITVTPEPDPPSVAASTVLSIAEDSLPGAVVGRAAVADPDGDPLTVTITDGDPAGDFSVSSTGAITLAAPVDFESKREYVLSIRVSDGTSSDTGLVTISVLDVNESPTANPLATTTPEDTSILIDVLVNDTDPENDALSIAGVGAPSQGAAVIEGDKIRYTPGTNVNGTDQFTYSLSDGSNPAVVATVTVTVNPVNDPPVAAPDADETDEDTTLLIDVGANDSDVEGDALTWSVGATSTMGGTMAIADGVVTYTPPADFNGTDSFTYTVTDGVSSPVDGAVTITIRPVNDRPVAVNDVEAATEDTAELINIGANDIDVDGDTLAWSVPATTAFGGTLSEADGFVTYTPPPDFDGTDSFSYTVTDGLSAPVSASVTIPVLGTQDPPEITSIAGAVGEDAPLGDVVFTVATTDPDGDALTLSITGGDPLGQFAIDNDGVLTVAAPLDHETQDSYSLTISAFDGTDTVTGGVAVTVTDSQESPIGVDDTGITLEDTSVLINVLANDSDPEGDTLSIIGFTSPTHGMVATEAGQARYTPPLNYTGTDTFSYFLSDGLNPPVTVNVEVTMVATNDSPVAEDDTLTVDEDDPGDVNIGANDSDPDGNPLTWNVPASTTAGGLLSETNGVVTYTPVIDFNGNDSFTYTVTDGIAPPVGATVTITVNPRQDPPRLTAITTSISEAAAINDVVDTVPVGDNDGDLITVTITDGDPLGQFAITDAGVLTVAGPLDRETTAQYLLEITVDDGIDQVFDVITVDIIDDNEPPQTTDDLISTNEDVDGMVDIGANDTDPEGEALTFTVPATTTLGGMLSETDGEVTYTPPADFFGSDSFTYTATDARGATSAPTTVNIVVFSVNDAPIANNDSGALFTTSEDTTFTTGDVLANDTDVDDGLDSSSIVVQSDVTSGVLTSLGDGTFTYAPDAEFSGTDSFTYTVLDNTGASSGGATVTITINDVNDPPVANADSLTVDYGDVATTVDLRLNDTDVEGHALTVTGASGAAEGTLTVNGDGTVTYEHTGTTELTDSFTYEIEDALGEPATGTVSVTIVPVEDSDAIPAATDVCPFHFDPMQLDTDGDGLGDVCDPTPTLAVASVDFTVQFGTTVGAGGESGAIAIGDVNNDGNMDGFLGYLNDTADRIYLGDGAGGATVTAQTLGEDETRGALLLDFDNDGDLDLAVAHFGATDWVYKNDGSGNFTAFDELSTDSTDSEAIAAGDFNKDGFIDLVVARDGTNRVFRNDGSGNFITFTTLGTNARGVAVGDINGDGNLDILFAEQAGNKPQYGDGTGNFTQGSDVGDKSLDVLLIDVDGDDDLDAVLAEEGNRRTTVWINDGTGDFTDDGQTIGMDDPTALAAGDLDGDGDLDLVIGHASDKTSVQLNDGNGNFTELTELGGTGSVTDVALVDADNSGTLDVVILRDGASDTLWFNN